MGLRICLLFFLRTKYLAKTLTGEVRTRKREKKIRIEKRGERRKIDEHNEKEKAPPSEA